MTKAKGTPVSSGTYISHERMRKIYSKERTLIFLSVGPILFFLIAVLEGIFGNDPVLRDSLMTSLVIEMLFVLMLLVALRYERKLSLVRRYNQIFMCDRDGVVTMKELSRQMGKPEEKILSELKWLFKHSLFCDCTLQVGGEPCVILSGESGSRSSFVNVICDKCTGTTRLRAGTSGKCDYCGSAITARRIDS
ncbi:hypothetical protein [Anaerotignum sp.]|uniref:hypothetical protein n=1 Tax=Anaerotignum sp. TaxID=2039241 RepID=UPI003736C359